ncbi:Pogo transposable element with KRAB domain, partial [Aphis craccivora]
MALGETWVRRDTGKMPRVRKRLSTRQNWCPESMNNAVLAVMNKSMSYRVASTSFNVPKSTLQRKTYTYIKANSFTNIIIINSIFGLQVIKLIKDDSYDPASKDSLGPIQTVFTTAEEKELVSYLQLMEGRLFGFSTVDCRKLAYQLAVKNNKKHNFSILKQEAGYDWYKGFMSRHPELSLRK